MRRCGELNHPTSRARVAGDYGARVYPMCLRDIVAAAVAGVLARIVTARNVRTAIRPATGRRGAFLKLNASARDARKDEARSRADCRALASP